MLRNGTVILYPYKKSRSFITNFVGRVICFVTLSKYTHASVYFRKYVYESTMFANNEIFGVRKTKSIPGGVEFYQLKTSLTRQQADRFGKILDKRVKEEEPYNIFKLLVLMIVYPTRNLWRKLGWIPFDNKIFGSICSEFVDEAFKAAGIDLIPSHPEGYTAPVDFTRSKLLEKVE